MATGLETFIERLQQTRTLAEIQDLTFDIRDHIGVTHIVYFWVNNQSQRYGAGTYTDEWIARYLEKDYMRIDPVILGCFQRFHPVDWKRLDWSGKARKAFLEDAIAYGVGNQGLAIPLRGPSGQFALFTMNHYCSDREWEQLIDIYMKDMMLLAHYINQKALEFEGEDIASAAKVLSPRETDALKFLAMGYNRAQAAESMSISEHTLRVYIESARFKLGAANTTHAVSRALSLGLIVV